MFSVVKAFAETREAENMNPEQKRYLADYLRAGKRGGLELSDEKLEQLKTLKKKLSTKWMHIDIHGNLTISV